MSVDNLCGSADNLLDIVDALDGHSIFKPEALVAKGLNAEVVKKMTRSFKSDTRDHKTTIFGRDGAVIDETAGVYGLDMLAEIAGQIGADTKHARSLMGRGFRAEAFKTAIRQKLIQGVGTDGIVVVG